MTAAARSEPQRVSIPQKIGKPALAVVDDVGNPVVAGRHFLAWHKQTGTYYVGRTEPRHYLRTRDRAEAIFRFRQWTAQQTMPPPVTIQTHLPLDEHGVARVISLVKHGAFVDATMTRDGIFVECSAPADSFWKQVREMILTDPALAARETGIPEIARLTELPRPQPSASLADIYAAYTAKKKQPSREELRKARLYWDFFARQVAPATKIEDVTPALLTKFEDAAYVPFHDGGSPKSLRHRFEYVMRLLRYAVRKQVDGPNCERVLADLTSRYAELPDSNFVDPRPIAPADFAKLVGAADAKWRAMLLVALNCCYYPCDIRTLPRAAVDLDRGTVVFERAKTRTVRVGLLWDRTSEAIRDYLSQEPHDAPVLFVSRKGIGYSGHGFRNRFRRLRTKAGVESSVEFASIRDGAYTAAIEGGASEEIAGILAGHKGSGSRDNYVKRRPQIVADATRAIEAHYFESTVPRIEQPAS